MTCRPGHIPGAVVVIEEAVASFAQLPINPELVFVCTRSTSAFIVDLTGRVVRRFAADNSAMGCFVSATLSPQGESISVLCCATVTHQSRAGKFAYCLTESGVMCVFDMKSGQLEETVVLAKPGSERGAITVLTHSPQRNLLSTLETSGVLRFWTA